MEQPQRCSRPEGASMRKTPAFAKTLSQIRRHSLLRKSFCLSSPRRALGPIRPADDASRSLQQRGNEMELKHAASAFEEEQYESLERFEPFMRSESQSIVRLPIYRHRHSVGEKQATREAQELPAYFHQRRARHMRRRRSPRNPNPVTLLCTTYANGKSTEPPLSESIAII